ncbi:MAG: mycofactocin precursor [Actinobacteria bacterium]|nr:mycofactocin precursor [Actinomycetota bacterium]
MSTETAVIEDVETAVLAAVEADELVEEELLVEEISIDGMCGVY